MLANRIPDSGLRRCHQNQIFICYHHQDSMQPIPLARASWPLHRGTYDDPQEEGRTAFQSWKFVSKHFRHPTFKNVQVIGIEYGLVPSARHMAKLRQVIVSPSWNLSLRGVVGHVLKACTFTGDTARALVQALRVRVQWDMDRNSAWIQEDLRAVRHFASLDVWRLRMRNHFLLSL